MAPRQSCNSLLDDCFRAPGLSELAHGEEVAPGQAALIRKRPLEIRGESLDHLRSPALPLPAIREGPGPSSSTGGAARCWPR